MSQAGCRGHARTVLSSWPHEGPHWGHGSPWRIAWAASEPGGPGQPGGLPSRGTRQRFPLPSGSKPDLDLVSRTFLLVHGEGDPGGLHLPAYHTGPRAGGIPSVRSPIKVSINRKLARWSALFPTTRKRQGEAGWTSRKRQLPLSPQGHPGAGDTNQTLESVLASNSTDAKELVHVPGPSMTRAVSTSPGQVTGH